MSGKYADDSTSVLLRLPKDLKTRLYEATERLNEDNPGANYSANSIVRAAITDYLDVIDGRKLKKNKKDK